MTSKKTNKDLIQSYILTTAEYDFSVQEKRILYRIVEQNQHLIEGKKLNKSYNIEQVNEGVYYTLNMSVSCHPLVGVQISFYLLIQKRCIYILYSYV